MVHFRDYFFCAPLEEQGEQRVGGEGEESVEIKICFSLSTFCPMKPTSKVGSSKVFAFIWNTQSPLESSFIFLFHLTPTY